ncbi:hypothetical protein Bca4012_019309 [Brassica carinata]
MGFSYGGTGIIIVGVILNDIMGAVCSILDPTRLFGAYSSASINKIPMDDMLPATKFKDMSRVNPPESCRICQDEFDGCDQHHIRVGMADHKEEASSGGDNAATRGTDWEVVSLTASAYAASPGPKPVQSKDDGNNKVVTTPPSEAAETSHPLYMSGHFVFPPTEEHHSNTEEPSEIFEGKASKKIDSEFSLEQEIGKEVGGDLTLKAKDDDVEFDFFEEEKGKSSNIYKASPLQDERAFGGSHVYEQTDHPDITPDVEDDDDDDDDREAANSPPPCEPWWKRSAASLISQAKETNTVWSIFIAAAVMGVVVLGQRWQHERWQVLQLNWESTIGNNEKAGRLMGPISRLKQAFVGGQRRDSFIRASSQNDS